MIGTFNATAKPYNSPMWRDILKGRSLQEKCLIVGFGNGNTTSLCYHPWVGSGLIYKNMDRDVPGSKAHWFVSQIIKNEKWNLADIDHLISNELKKQILAIPIPQSSDI